jgi:hypothetical protein
VNVSEQDPPEHGVVSQLTTSSLANNSLTRLWARADASHGHHIEAVADLRERKRREREETRSGGYRHREAAQAAHDPVGSARVECVRCKRTLKRTALERVAIRPPVGEAVEHLLCPRCADEVRRGLLRLLVGQPALPAATRGEQ